MRISTKQHVHWWNISWNGIPADYVNGILLGYRLTYYMSYRSGKLLGGEHIKTIIEVNNLTFYYKVSGLVNYATYDVTIAGYTIAGEGPSEVKMTGKCAL